MWIPQKRLASHSNKWVSSQIKSASSVTIKVVNKCLLYITRISLTSQKGHFDLFPTWYKSFFTLTAQHKDKREILLCNVSESHKKGMCVCTFFQLHCRGNDDASLLLSPKKYRIISKILEFLCKDFETRALMSNLMSLAFFVSWKEAVPQKKLEGIKNAEKKISRD